MKQFRQIKENKRLFSLKAASTFLHGASPQKKRYKNGPSPGMGRTGFVGMHLVWHFA